MDGELFVGRRDEVELLRNALASVKAGIGGMVLVTGEQGVGKSTLLARCLENVEGAGYKFLRGAADELGQQVPLQLMAECVGVRGGPGGWVTGGEGVFAGDAVLAGIERMLAAVDRLCADSPVVLVAEDLQWADEASLLVWHRLSRAVDQLPLLLVGSCRPGARQEDLARLERNVLERGGSIVDLGPLGKDEINQLSERLAGGRPGRRLAGVVRRAGGNPLYARELVDSLVRDRRVQVVDGMAELSGAEALVHVPASLAAAIAGRIGSLTDDVSWVLRWAAVLGQEFSVTDLKVVTGRSAGELIGVVDAAVVGGVVAEAGAGLRFRHGLIRQALYEGMPAGLRAALHLQAARALAGAEAAPGLVAWQLVRALAVPERVAGGGSELDQDDGSAGAAGTHLTPGRGTNVLAGEPADAWTVEWVAGAAPSLIYRAPQVAAELLRGVLGQLARDDPRREVLQASLVTVAFLLQEYEEVERVGVQAVAQASDPGRCAEMSWLLAYALMRMGRLAEAVATVTEALARPGVDEVQRARLGALHAIILTSLEETDQAADVAKEALACATRTRDRLAAGYALHALSTVSFVRRDLRAMLEQMDQALTVIEADPQATDLRLLLLANKTLYFKDTDQLAEAGATGRYALAVADQAGTPRLQMIRITLACVYFEAGQWDDALAELEPVADLPGPAYVPLVMHALSGLIAGHRDEREKAEEHVRAVGDEAMRTGPALANSYLMRLARSLVLERAGRSAEAMAELAQCLQPGIAEGMPGLYIMLPTLVRLALASDDADTAAAAARAAEDEAQRHPLPLKEAVNNHCRGLVTGGLALVLAAAGYYGAVGLVLFHAQALEDAAVLAAEHDDVASARRLLAEAMVLYSKLGASWDIFRAGVRLRPYGIRLRREAYRSRPVAGWESLTPTEVKVAHLVAKGMSNPDIAAELFLSRNTVQTHVSHMLAKLGARSRTEIAREALMHLPAGRSATA
jgi:DNA-binding CsgD family transcriptional regulator